MKRTLSRDQKKALHAAIISASGSSHELLRIVRFGLDVNLFVVTPQNQNLSAQACDLIDWCERRGRLDELIQTFVDDNPTNPEFQAFIEGMWGSGSGVAHQPKAQHFLIRGLTAGVSKYEDVIHELGMPAQSMNDGNDAIDFYRHLGLTVRYQGGRQSHSHIDVLMVSFPFAEVMQYGIHIGMPGSQVARALQPCFVLVPERSVMGLRVFRPGDDAVGDVLTVFIKSDLVSTIQVSAA